MSEPIDYEELIADDLINITQCRENAKRSNDDTRVQLTAYADKVEIRVRALRIAAAAEQAEEALIDCADVLEESALEQPTAAYLRDFRQALRTANAALAALRAARGG